MPQKVSDERLKHFTWCVEKQMEKCWDFRDELAAALRELTELRAQNKWHDTDDDVPQEHGIYLVYGASRGCGVRKGFSVGMYGYSSYTNAVGFSGGVTHWRKLPEAPEAE